MNDISIIRLEPPSTLAVPSDSHGKILGLVDLWLAGLAETSRRTYASALRDFGSVAGMEVAEVVRLLLVDRGGGHAMVLAYRGSLLERGRAPNTINLRLAALRSLVTHARTLGLVDWHLEVSSVRARTYRDTRGPGRRGFQELLRAASTSTHKERNTALLWCLYGLALRRGECSALQLADVDLEGARLEVIGKGHRDAAPVTLPPPVVAALRAWIEVRGSEAGPLFQNYGRGPRGDGSLSGRAIASILADLGDEVAVKARPHGLRHASITDALEITRGDLRAVARFSRHADVRTLQRYDDSREDLGGKVANLVTAAASLEVPK